MKPPLYYITIPIALGIIAQRELSWFMLGLILVFVALNWSKKYPIIAFTLSGFALGVIAQNHNQIPYNRPIEVVSRVESFPEKTANGKWLRFTSQVISFKDSTTNWHGVDQKLQTYVDTSLNVALGNTIIFKTKHYQFDSVYKKYYQNQNISGRVFARELRVIESDTTLFERVTIASNNLSNKLGTINTTTENIGLMQALTLGDKSNLSREQRRENNLAGTAHILAVSGLHVGIIFMILSYLLGWIKLLKRGQMIYGVTIIVVLWAYAAMTGFLPPVLRAVIMFTLYQIGTLFYRNSNNFNTLLAAGLILLLCNPNYVYDIGFQLSFAAMFGITLLYKPIYSLWNNRVWSLVSISLAAQIAVAPLACYYFGTIPLFGVFTNLALWVVVPAIILLAFSYLMTGWAFTGNAAAVISSLYNNFVGWSASQPWIAVKDVEMPQWVCFAIYAIMILVIRLTLMRNKNATGKSPVEALKKILT